ncbi:MAG: type I 3-dehydroquinate dehydratase [Luteitalea sp.]
MVTLADLDATALAVEREAALRVADLVEFRLDRLDRMSVADMLGDAAGRAIVTCRPVREGGSFQGPEAEREVRLREALDGGAAFVDVEWDAPFADALMAQCRDRVVLSRHDFSGMPRALPGMVAEMAARRPAVVKLAVSPSSLVDVRLLHEARRAAGNCPVVLIGMGAVGLPSRLLPTRFGSCWTYSGAAIAPGQVPATMMRNRYGVGRQTGRTQLCGVAGRPIGHSWSPLLHNAALRQIGIDAVYVPLQPLDVVDLLTFATAFDMRGLSVTAPFKVDALARADRADAMATRLGAANTLTRDGNEWTASNTDVAGFLHPLRGRLALNGLRAAVLGAGGAARAVVAGLVDQGAQVVVHARRAEQAQPLEGLGAVVGEWPPRTGTWDLLVNTTPVGTAPDVEASPIHPDVLAAGGFVYDLVYNPGRTRLLRDAAAAGCATLGGLEMLIAHAALQLSTWFGVDPPIEAMRAAIHAEAPHLALAPETPCPR